MNAGRHIDNCRFCGGRLAIPFCDLGATPLANSYVPPEQAAAPDPRFPLNAVACADCFLVQLDHVADATGIFTDYAYFSSFSSSWMTHAARFASAIAPRLGLGSGSLVVEVASNDGYLLRNFVAAGIPCLGIEPAANVAEAAIRAGVPTEVRFFGRDAAADIVARRGHADLVIANNVMAHVPDINDFTAGLALLAGPRGIISIESPHLLRLVDGVQFDTIYHEHYAYWSVHALAQVLGAHGLRIKTIERLPTHGGSLRVLATAPDTQLAGGADALDEVLAEEASRRVAAPEFYAGFQAQVNATLDGFRAWLRAQHNAGRTIAAYGAAAKGNTLLNAAGITAADVTLVADRNPAKQGKLLPGSRIPVTSPEQMLHSRPDDILILPWNLADEIAGELAAARDHGARLWIAVPQMRRIAG